MSNPMSPAESLTLDLDELERLAREATPGPWTQKYTGQDWWIASCGIGDDGMTVWSPVAPTRARGGVRKDDGGEADRRNAAYIVALVNAAPELIRLARIALEARDE